eukprot:gene1109-1209_t
MGIAGSVLDDEPASPRGLLPFSANPNRATASSPQFVVSLGFWPDNRITLPASFYLRISYESLDFVEKEKNVPLVQFPFQNILCWGSSPQNFQFKVFDLEAANIDKRNGGVLITLKTSQGKMIEEATMSSVKQLMADIKLRAISDGEFAVLLTTILDGEGILKEEWLQILDQFTSSGRLFLAKQGIELLHHISKQASFEKFDLVCMIYDRMLNKNSIQLLVNTFEDPQERENLSLRLKTMEAAQKKQQQHQQSQQQSQQTLQQQQGSSQPAGSQSNAIQVNGHVVSSISSSTPSTPTDDATG